MKHAFNFCLVGILAFAAACQQAPKGDEAKISETQSALSGGGTTFKVDTADSFVRFVGHGVGKNHPGRFKITEGTVSISDGAITAGSFTINIHSLSVEEQGEMFQTKLKPHLLSGDFFDAERFGDAKFVITKVEPYEASDADKSIVDGANYRISGNLTLKGTSKNITFPARINLDGNTLKGKANFDIDRREWQMNYGNDKTLGDKFISETVNIELDIQAEKAS